MLNHLAKAGTEMHCVELLKAMDRRDFAPYMVLLTANPSDRDDLEGPGCEVSRLGVRSLLRPSSLAKLLRLAAELRRRKIDLLQTFSPDSTYFGLLAAKIAGVPVVVRSLRNTGYWMRRRDRLMQSICSPFIDWNIANSEASARSGRCFGVQPSKLTVIPNGIDVARFQNLEVARLSSDGGQAHVGIVANLRPVKNLDLLIDASASLIGEHPGIRITVAGEGPERGRLENRIQALGLDRQVTLAGSVNDIPSFLEGLDVAVLCSESEGLPTAVIEYMAAARPIVATSVGGVAELIRHEVTGLLVPSGDWKALAAAIDRLLADRELASRIGRAARTEALDKYTSERQMHEYREVWVRLIEAHGRRDTSGTAAGCL